MTFKLPGGDTITPRANFGYVGNQWATLFQNVGRGDLLDARKILNAQLAYTRGTLTVTAYGTNLTNQHYVARAQQRALFRRGAAPVRRQGAQGLLTSLLPAAASSRRGGRLFPSRTRLEGAMQPYGLTVDKFLDHAAKWFGDREIVEAGCRARRRRGSAMPRCASAATGCRARCWRSG